MSDLTIVYYTANVIEDHFMANTQEYLLKAAQGQKIICVSKKPMTFGDENIVMDTPRSHINIYRQALEGAKAADTKYIALAEDDVLYSTEHFKRRPAPGKFGYNLGTWNIHTWGEPLFTHKGGGRRCLHSLICERELFIEAMEERFAKYPNGTGADIWGEPSKYERHLGVTVRDSEEFFTNPPNIVFIHQTALAFKNLGTKKRLGEFRAIELPYWGRAEQIVSLYKNEKIRPINTNTI
jgi:hypothetical protein